MADRNFSMDTLRTIATFLVVLTHHASWFAAMDPVKLPVHFWTGNIYTAITRVCVPFFVLISGNFILNDRHDMSVTDFYFKRMKRLIPPLLFWTLFYTIYLIIEMASRDGGNYCAIIREAFTGEKSLHLWYLYMLIGLYFVTPAIMAVRKNLTEKQFLIAGCLLLLIGMLNDMWCVMYKINRLWLVWFIDYLGYYMLGASLATITSRLNKYWYLLIFLLTCAAAAFLNYTLAINDIESYYPFANVSTAMIIESISLYAFFLRTEIKANLLSKLAGYSFGIYLVHAFIVSLIFRNLKTVMLSMPLITIPAGAILTFGLSLGITYLLTLNRYTRKVV